MGSIFLADVSDCFTICQAEVASHVRRRRDTYRIFYVSTGAELYSKMCTATKTKYAVFDSEDRQKAMGKDICKMIPVQSSYFETWIASAVKRGFKYKRSFDIGLAQAINYLGTSMLHELHSSVVHFYG